MDAELLKLMERSGCYSFALGIESGSDRVLKMMRKGMSTHQMRKKIQLVSETTKIRITGFFICGYPGENEDDLKKTEELILNEPFHRVCVDPFIPFPGSQIYEKLRKEKKLPEKCNWNLFSGYEENIFVAGPLSKERLLRFRRRIHLKFYLRLRIIIGVLSELNSFRQFRVALRMLFFWLGIAKIKKTLR